MPKYPNIHCSLGDRAWTDLVTNTTFLSGMQVEKYLASLIKPGAFPRSCFPAFIHEAVHHWCFHSPVGTTLALLQMRARRRALKLGTQYTDSAFDVVEDLLRYEIAVELMKPLAEGLSLYAEFDATPKSDSQIISPPFLWLTLSFTNPAETVLYESSPDKTKASPLYKLLCSMRLSGAYSRRKTNLLLSTMSCSEGGYLPGYINVSSM